MFNPNDQMLLPLLAIRPALDPSGEPYKPAPASSIRRRARRVRPNIVRLIPGATRLPIGYAPR